MRARSKSTLKRSYTLHARGTIEAVVFATKNGRLHERTFPRVDIDQLEVEHFAACVRTQRELALRQSETLENIATMEAIFAAAGQDWPIV